MAEYEVAVPPGIEVRIEGNAVTVAGPLGRLQRTFTLAGITTEQATGRLVLRSGARRRADMAYLGTVAAHIRGMIAGVARGHTYRLRVVYAHFPINVAVEAGRVVIRNYAGEKRPRYAAVVPGATVEAKGQDITVRGADLAAVSQTAANIEQATRTAGRDPRVFQDGIYIVSKGEPA